MDTTTLIEAYGELGVIGICMLLFGFMITNLIRSQATQNDSLDEISVNIAKSESTTENVEGILLKLLDRIQRESEQQNDERNRRHEAVMKEIDDLSDKVSYLSGRINGSGR